MKIFFNQAYDTPHVIEEELTQLNLQDAIKKTRQALDIAYAGFDNALEVDLIDSYIYEITALQKRYKHLLDLADAQTAREQEPLYPHSPIRALVSHVFG